MRGSLRIGIHHRLKTDTSIEGTGRCPRALRDWGVGKAPGICEAKPIARPRLYKIAHPAVRDVFGRRSKRRRRSPPALAAMRVLHKKQRR
jgi:hypothetical protein